MISKITLVAEIIFTLWFAGIVETSAFICQIHLRTSYQQISSPTVRTTETSIFGRSKKASNGNTSSKKSKNNEKNGTITLGEFVKRIEKDEGKFSRKVKRKRTRRRTDAPKQNYLYASQRKAFGKTATTMKNTAGASEYDEKAEELSKKILKIANNPIELARNLGMNPAAQFCSEQSTFNVGLQKNGGCNIINVGRPHPQIIGELGVGNDGEGKSTGSATGRYAYIINKPAGWSILDAKKKKTNDKLKIGDKECITEVGKRPNTAPLSDDGEESQRMEMHLKRVKYFDEDSGKFERVEYDERDILSVMTPQEILEFEKEGGLESLNERLNDSNARKAKLVSDTVAKNSRSDEEEIESFVEKSCISSHDKIISPLPLPSIVSTAMFSPSSRPSLVAWLKDTKAAEGITVRGGNNWKALSGAVDIDDSGLVLLCPKEKEDNVHVDEAKYVVVVGNDGKYLAPKGKKKKRSRRLSLKDEDRSTIEIMSKIRKGRGDDIIVSSKVSILDGLSNCNDAVQICQNEYQDGVRGDPAANPLDRRANRRLVHCSELSVSSLSQDDFVNLQAELPDDIRIFSDRKNNHKFKDGSFLGRRDLKNNDSTTAYREINGAADGFPGWIVDRYGQWLLVQHDENFQRGPLPSIHDGNTLGVYYFVTNRDRSAMNDVKPVLLEGQPAPDIVEVKENGITYHISFDDLSTGIFLDQRHQRAWLAKYCTEETRVLNCFSHCGAFSVAAATAGALTVNLDLSKKWLDRIEPQMKANGIKNFTERHDCIYGDCFDWLRRLAKRGEKYDIVIVDPPSTSVGGNKKKRWSAKNDYSELVTLASKLVKREGLLWTTTNAATISPIAFARICEKGLVNAGITNAKLERVASMPSDFPTIGSPPVKNFVWRMP